MVIMSQLSKSVFIRLFSCDTKPKQLTLKFFHLCALNTKERVGVFLAEQIGKPVMQIF